MEEKELKTANQILDIIDIVSDRIDLTNSWLSSTSKLVTMLMVTSIAQAIAIATICIVALR